MVNVLLQHTLQASIRGEDTLLAKGHHMTPRKVDWHKGRGKAQINLPSQDLAELQNRWLE